MVRTGRDLEEAVENLTYSCPRKHEKEALEREKRHEKPGVCQIPSSSFGSAREGSGSLNKGGSTKERSSLAKTLFKVLETEHFLADVTGRLPGLTLAFYA